MKSAENAGAIDQEMEDKPSMAQLVMQESAHQSDMGALNGRSGGS